MRFYLTTKTFCVELTQEEWEILNRNDEEECRIMERLEKADCFNVEWNGHFGRNLYFSCLVENVRKAKAAVRKELKKK